MSVPILSNEDRLGWCHTSMEIACMPILKGSSAPGVRTAAAEFLNDERVVCDSRSNQD